jgi:hypothetical protein
VKWPGFERAVNRTAVGVFGSNLSYLHGPTNRRYDGLRGVFDSAVESLSVSEEGSEVMSLRPQVMIRISDLPVRPVVGDMLTIEDAGEFTVASPAEDDGAGMWRLWLHEA